MGNRSFAVDESPTKTDDLASGILPFYPHDRVPVKSYFSIISTVIFRGLGFCPFI
jgi:hypothetical protein